MNYYRHDFTLFPTNDLNITKAKEMTKPKNTQWKYSAKILPIQYYQIKDSLELYETCTFTAIKLNSDNLYCRNHFCYMQSLTFAFLRFFRLTACCHSKRET